DGGVAILRPRVDGEVRLGDDDDAADSERVELVKYHVHDGGLRALGRLDHRRLHGFKAVERFCVAIEQLEQQVSSQCLHSLPPFPSSLARAKFCCRFFECRAMFLALKGKKGRESDFWGRCGGVRAGAEAPRSRSWRGRATPARPPNRAG